MIANGGEYGAQYCVDDVMNQGVMIGASEADEAVMKELDLLNIKYVEIA
jgi:hypothetical protein